MYVEQAGIHWSKFSSIHEFVRMHLFLDYNHICQDTSTTEIYEEKHTTISYCTEDVSV